MCIYVTIAMCFFGNPQKKKNKQNKQSKRKKKQAISMRQVTHDEAYDMCINYGIRYIEVSAKSDYNIEQCFIECIESWRYINQLYKQKKKQNQILTELASSEHPYFNKIQSNKTDSNDDFSTDESFSDDNNNSHKNKNKNKNKKNKKNKKSDKNNKNEKKTNDKNNELIAPIDNAMASQISARFLFVLNDDSDGDSEIQKAKEKKNQTNLSDNNNNYNINVPKVNDLTLIQSMKNNDNITFGAANSSTDNNMDNKNNKKKEKKKKKFSGFWNKNKKEKYDSDDG